MAEAKRDIPEWQKAPAIGRAVRKGESASVLPLGVGKVVSAPVPEGLKEPLSFLNRGILSTLGMPVDAANAALGLVGLGSERPFLGSRDLTERFRSIGGAVASPDEQARTMGARVGEGIGLAAGFLLPGAGLVGAASRAASPTIRGVAEMAKAPFISQPLRATAAELAAGAGAGAGGLIAEREAQRRGIDPTVGRIVGELGGGLVAGAGPAALGAAVRKSPAGFVARKAGEGIKSAVTPFTESGGRIRASRRLKALSPRPEEEAKRAAEATELPLTPAQRTGNPRLMALEREIRSARPDIDERLAAREAEVSRVAEQKLREPGGEASPQDAAEFVRQQRERIANEIQQRVAAAERRAQERIAKLAPERRESEASAIVREELERAYSSARQKERALWEKVPRDVLVETRNARERLEAIKRDLGEPQHEDIPAEAIRFLDRDRNTAFGEQASVRDMQALRSKLLETARKARAAGELNKARIADELADAVLADMEGQGARGGLTFEEAQDLYETGAEVADFFESLAEVRRDVARLRKRPLTDFIKKRGGIDPSGPIAAELRARDITPRTAPGLFRKGGLKDLDNIPAEELPEAREIGLGIDESGHISRQSLIDAIEAEARGEAARTVNEQELLRTLEEMERELPRMEELRRQVEEHGITEPPFPGDFERRDVAGPLAAAREFSRKLNETFRQGRVGQLLGTERVGGPSVAPELTLGTSIGRGGLQGAISVDELRAAVGDSPNAEAAMRDFIRRRFMDAAAPRGEFDPGRAQDFLRKNAELLDRFPDVKRDVEAAIREGAFTRELRETVERGLKEAERAPDAAFASAPVGREIESILNARDPRQAAHAVIRRLSDDKSGEALRGLKAAASDFLIRKATLPDGSLSGQRMIRLLSDKRTRAAFSEIFDKDEMKRALRIADELRRAEMARGRLPDVGGIITDPPNRIIAFLTRTLAARSGAQAGAGTSGASLLTAHFASKQARELLGRLTNDKAVELLSDAIDDPELFSALMTRMDIPSQKEARAVKRLVEWFGGTAPQLLEESRGQREPATPSYLMAPAIGRAVRQSDAAGPRGTVLPEVRERLSELESRIGRPLKVISGLRSPEHNRRVGGAPRSQHLHGNAVDLDVRGMSLEERKRLLAEAKRAGFTGFGVYKNSIHLDMGPPRAWGPSRHRDSLPAWARPVIESNMAAAQ